MKLDVLSVWRFKQTKYIVMNIGTMISETKNSVKHIEAKYICTNMHQWSGSALVQVSAWCWTAARPLSEPTLTYWSLDFKGKTIWNRNQITRIFIQRNVFIENGPCKIYTILSRPQSADMLTLWSQDKMAVISQTTSSNAFSWMKMYEFHLRFNWSLFLKYELTIFQHWLR